MKNRKVVQRVGELYQKGKYEKSVKNLENFIHSVKEQERNLGRTKNYYKYIFADPDCKDENMKRKAKERYEELSQFNPQRS